MGILTGFRAVDLELFRTITDEDRFESFLDYLNGWAEASTVNLPANTEIPRLSLDKGWDDIEYLLRAVTDAEANAYKRYVINVEAYQKLYAFYYPLYESFDVLRSHRLLCQSVIKRDWSLFEVKNKAVPPNYFYILDHNDFAASLPLLEAEIMKQVNEREVYSDFFREPFNDATAEYVYHHYSSFLKFLMETIFPTESEVKEFVIIGLQL